MIDCRAKSTGASAHPVRELLFVGKRSASVGDLAGVDIHGAREMPDA